jgi:hypothetical protein
MSELDLILWIGVAALIGIAVDTYFWVRTQLRLREYRAELEPRLVAIDEFAARFAEREGLPAPNGGSTYPGASVRLKVLRAKNGRPYVRTPGGMSRFLTEDQARAIERGGGPPAGGPLGPRPDVAAALGGPDAPEGVPGRGGAPPPEELWDLDYAGMAKRLGRPESEVRQFLAAHVVRASSDGSPGAEELPPSAAGGPSAEEPWDQLLRGLAEGTLNKDAARTLATEALLRRGGATGPPTDGSSSGTGVSWGEA